MEDEFAQTEGPTRWIEYPSPLKLSGQLSASSVAANAVEETHHALGSSLSRSRGNSQGLMESRSSLVMSDRRKSPMNDHALIPLRRTEEIQISIHDSTAGSLQHSFVADVSRTTFSGNQFKGSQPKFLLAKPPSQQIQGVYSYHFLKIVGYGTTSTVWKSLDQSHGTMVAVKVIDWNASHLKHVDRNNAAREVTILSRLKHPNITELLEVVCHIHYPSPLKKVHTLNTQT
eukprot:TRINITY_DN4783_c0_g1_i3.p1 TRINITY_DN4783_c0_g1~~TRINITY_DN4783_c0_g1_i3.p1  ORF type:complete len:230 (+),score=32.23 TRINITY_DN4783_c0_g1_i3:84-773(+)